MRSWMLVLVLAVGCNPPVTVEHTRANLYFADDVPEEDRAFWRAAAVAWNEAADATLINDEMGEADFGIYAQVGTRLIGTRHAGEAQMTSARLSEVWMRPDVGANVKPITTSHELGHAQGLRHSSDKDSVMYYAIVRDEHGNSHQTITPDDVAAVRAAMGVEEPDVVIVGWLATPLVNKTLPPGYTVEPFGCDEP